MDFGTFVAIQKFLTNEYVLIFLFSMLILVIIPTQKKLVSFLNDQTSSYKKRLDNLLEDDVETKKKVEEIYDKVEIIYEKLAHSNDVSKDRYIDILSKLQDCQNELKNIVYSLETNFRDLHILSNNCKSDIIDSVDLSKHGEKLDKIMIDNVKICEILNNLKASITKLDNLITMTLNKSPVIVSKFDDSDLLQSINNKSYSTNKKVGKNDEGNM